MRHRCYQRFSHRCRAGLAIPRQVCARLEKNLRRQSHCSLRGERRRVFVCKFACDLIWLLFVQGGPSVCVKLVGRRGEPGLGIPEILDFQGCLLGAEVQKTLTVINSCSAARFRFIRADHPSLSGPLELLPSDYWMPSNEPVRIGQFMISPSCIQLDSKEKTLVTFTFLPESPEHQEEEVAVVIDTCQVRLASISVSG